MNMMKATGGLVALSLVAAALPVYADGAETKPKEEVTGLEEKDDFPLSVEVSLDVLSDYVWRGTICNGNPVWQPSVTLGYDLGDWGALSANVWQSYDLTHKRGTATNSRRACGLQEIDYTLAYAVSLADFDFEVGHIFYTFPNNNGASDQDLYATVAYNNPIVTPSASVYWNYNSAHGEDPSAIYFSFGLAHDFEPVEGLTLTPSASLGFGDNAWSKYVTDESAGTELTDQTIGLAASYAITENVSVGAQINYTWIPSHTLRHLDYMGCGKSQLLWGGVNATFSF